MTDDLVKRLRQWGAFGYGHEASKTMHEAADRIEELLKFKSLHAACDKVSLDIEQKLVNQLAAAHKRNSELEAELQLYKDGNHFEALKRERAELAGEKKDG